MALLWCRPAKAKRHKKHKQVHEAEAGAASAVAAQDKGNVLVWLRQDLRLHDNATLCEAAAMAKAAGAGVAFVYVHSPAEDGSDYDNGKQQLTKSHGRAITSLTTWAQLSALLSSPHCCFSSVTCCRLSEPGS